MTIKAPAVLINEDDFEIGYSDAIYMSVGRTRNGN